MKKVETLWKIAMMLHVQCMQGLRNWVRARLSPMCLGFDSSREPYLGSVCVLVLSPCSLRGFFFSVYSAGVSILPWFSNSIWIKQPHESQLWVMWILFLNIVIYLFIEFFSCSYTFCFSQSAYCDHTQIPLHDLGFIQIDKPCFIANVFRLF